MKIEKGTLKKFDSEVIFAILSERAQKRFDSGKFVNMGDIAEVNEHLFPFSGKCFGILVGQIALSKSKPEILKQHPEFNNLDFNISSKKELIKILSNKVSLTSTGN